MRSLQIRHDSGRSGCTPDIDAEPRTEQPPLSPLLLELLQTDNVVVNSFQRLKEESVLTNIERTLRSLETRFNGKDVELSTHELCVAASSLYWCTQEKNAMRGTISKEKRRTHILNVFATASLLELSEKWWTTQPAESEQSVCN